ncbi:MAG TPA: caspase family protein, partial [Burkholderiaceae bacterium]
YTVQSLFGPQATRQAIETQIGQLSRELGADDVLFIYISSHGALPLPAPEGNDARHMSIVAYDSGDILGQRSRDATDYLLKLQRTSVRDSLVQALAQQPTRQTRVLVDTCYSGDMLRALDRPGGDALLSDRDSISIEAWSRLAQNLRSRYTLLTATSPGELALGPPIERGVFPSPLSPQRQLRGSFFTQTLFEYLDQRGGLLQAAFADAQAFTAQTARRVSGGQQAQTPRMLSTMEPGIDRL